MSTELFERFTQLVHSGRRKEAAVYIRGFVSSFTDLSEKIEWAKQYLEGQAPREKIRHELYEGVIFPALMESYRRAEPWGIRWLARTMHNLFQAQLLWQQVGFKTESTLLQELLAICPTDEAARQELLSAHIEGFTYAVHEWPAGILYGHDGATLDQCEEIKSDIAYARKLDEHCMHSEFLDDFQEKLASFTRRIAHNDR